MRKNNNNNEKKNCVEPFLGYCPNYIVKRKFLYCNLGFVLQERGLEKKNCSENCIAIPFLYCRRCQIVL